MAEPEIIDIVATLSIAKNAALHHGGELILEDSPLGGLRVRLLLNALGGFSIKPPPVI